MEMAAKYEEVNRPVGGELPGRGEQHVQEPQMILYKKELRSWTITHQIS